MVNFLPMINAEIYSDNALEFIKSILDHLPDGVFTLNHQHRISYVNSAFCELMGYEAEELVGTDIKDYVADLSILLSCQQDIERQGYCRNHETKFIAKNGDVIRVYKNVQLLGADNKYHNLIVSLRDMTEVYNLNASLQQKTQQLSKYNQNLSQLVEERTQDLNQQMAFLSSYKKALDESSLVTKCDLDRELKEVNQAFCRRTGYQPLELLGRRCSQLWSEPSAQLDEEIQQAIMQRKPWKGLVKLRAKDQSSLYLESCIVPICNELGQFKELVNISHDVTPLIETTQTLAHRLYTDALTELPNRLKLMSDLDQAAATHPIALLNIDSFNEINALYGHDVADCLLTRIAQHLLNEVEHIPVALYKLPIDEFVLRVEQDWDVARLQTFVREVLFNIHAESFEVEGEQINITMSAGIAEMDLEQASNDVLLAADMALKLAKTSRHDLVVYNPDLKIKQRYQHNISWIKRLRSAIDEDRLVPFFQPVMNAQTLQVDYYECLVRVVEKDGQVVTPYHFLDVAKKLKLYHQLTKTMIDKAFEKFADQTEKFSLNLSIEDIADPLMYDWIINRVRNCAFADRIIFEIVESEGIQNYDVVNRFVQEVKRYGVAIAIDDFGAGYSNFVYIMRLDIDFIKIDGSIIRDIVNNHSSQVITETLVDFAQKLGIQTVAEFVADEAILQHLKQLPIDSLQGFYLGEPMPDLIKTVGSA